MKTSNGIARIKADISYINTTSGEISSAVTFIDQNIDHDSPYVPIFTHPATGTIKTDAPLTITFTDRWGNLIDSRNPAEIHTVSLHVHGPDPDDCGFVEGALLPHDVSKTLDANGNISAIISLTSRAGSNNILLDQFGSIPDKMRSIVAISDAVPVRMDAFIDPDGSPPTVVADGTSKFTIQYILYDQYGNPTVGQPVNFTSSEPAYYEDQLTMANGDVWYTFGPKSFTGSYSLTAKAANNNSVSDTMIVRFYNSSPSNVEITANPQSMPSRDVDPNIYSTVSAKVVDIVGNPVSGEDVTFDIHSIVYSPGSVGYKETPSFDPASELLTITETTNAQGIAAVRFYPTNFSVIGESGYEQSATGTGTVTATWNGVQRDIDLTWKNYPYLSAVLTITPSQVTVGDTIDINLKLTGDGWAMTSKPIDVVLTTDRSGSMWGSKMTAAKNAATLFTNNLTVQDYEGLVSFGGTTTTDQALTNSKSTLTAKINGYVASGMTPMRSAIYQSAYMIKNTARPNSVRAVIILTDGEWNNDGDPLGGSYVLWLGDGVAQGSVIDYVRDNNMKLFIIGLGVSSSYRTVLEGYVNTVGGGSKYYHAPTEGELAGIYADIAGELQESAGVDTTAVMDFGSIIVNDQMDTSGEVFLYIADPETDGITTGPPTQGLGSTMVRKYNETHELIPGTGYSQIGPLYDNMTGYWNSNTPHHLLFDIGEVKLQETWETNFRLRVLKEGSISMMGPNSAVSFQDTTTGDIATLNLVNLSTFTSTQDTVFTGATWQTITISDFKRTDTPTGDGDLTSSLPVTWTTTYTGIRPVTHDVLFIHDNDPPVRFDQFVTTGSTKTLYSQLDMTKLPPGGYQIRVYAHADDADAIDTIGPWSYNTQTRAFIKLE